MVLEAHVRVILNAGRASYAAKQGNGREAFLRPYEESRLMGSLRFARLPCVDWTEAVDTAKTIHKSKRLTKDFDELILVNYIDSAYIFRGPRRNLAATLWKQGLVLQSLTSLWPSCCKWFQWAS